MAKNIDISTATDAQIEAELDAIRAGDGYHLLGELQLEIERRLADAIRELYDRQQIARRGLDRRATSTSYIDIAKCSIEANLVRDAKRDIDRKQAMLKKLAEVSAHLEAIVV
jgi:hypothetical protein